MRLFQLGVSAVVLAASTASFGYDFVGAESCKGCHAEAYESWRQSKHARAHDSLSPQQQQDARCLSCHSPNLSEQQANVTCETCHGGGQYYSAQYVMKDSELVRLVGLLDPSEKTCRTCHDASSPSLKPFEFVEKLKLIDHWSAERKRRAEAAAAAAPEPKKK
jgi:formate-dependent nitrite reductase cytochrome c552 subunit